MSDGVFTLLRAVLPLSYVALSYIKKTMHFFYISHMVRVKSQNVKKKYKERLNLPGYSKQVNKEVMMGSKCSNRRQERKGTDEQMGKQKMKTV